MEKKEFSWRTDLPPVGSHITVLKVSPSEKEMLAPVTVVKVTSQGGVTSNHYEAPEFFPGLDSGWCYQGDFPHVGFKEDLRALVEKAEKDLEKQILLVHQRAKQLNEMKGNKHE